MRKVQSRWAQGRRTFIVGAFVAAGFTVAATAPAFAQAASAPPAAQAPATQTPAPAAPAAQAAPPALTFDGDAGLILMQVKPDKTADFESVMAKLHQALAKSDKPERRQQAGGSVPADRAARSCPVREQGSGWIERARPAAGRRLRRRIVSGNDA